MSNTENEESKRPTMSFMSKRKYVEMQQFIHASCEKEVAESICRKICEVMRFDPDVGLYSKKKVKQVTEWRERKAKELGLTVAQVRRGLKHLKLNQEKPGQSSN